MTEACARMALGWRYEPPYDFYNPDPQHLDIIIQNSFLNPAYHYFSVFDAQEALIAFRCYGEDARVPGGDYSDDALDVGGGLRPDLTGQGLGPQIMRAEIEFAIAQFTPHTLRATVAEFNLRARRACEKVGYGITQRFVATHNGVPFVILVRNTQPE